MKKVFLKTLFLALLILPIAYFFLLSYVNSTAFRELVQKSASQAINGHLIIPSLSLTFPLRITATDIKVTDNLGENTGLLKKIHLDIAPHTLFSNHILVHKIILEEPTIIWRINEPLPAPAFIPTPQKIAESPSSQTSGNQDSPPPKTPTEGVATQRSAAPRSSAQKKQLSINAISIQHGSLQVLDISEQLLIKLHGLELFATLTTTQAGLINGQGELKISQVNLPENLQITRITSPFTFSTQVIELEQIEAIFYEGQLSGKFSADIPSGTYTVNTEIINSSLHQLLKATNQTSLKFHNTRLNLTVQAQGNFSEPQDTLTGQGEFAAGPMSVADIPGADALLLILHALGISESTQIENAIMENLHGYYTISDSKIHLSEARTFPADAPVLLSARGNIGFDSALDIDSQLMLSARHFHLPHKLVRVLGETGKEGYLTVPFTLTGTTEKPHIEPELDNILTSTGKDIINRAEDLLKGITRPESREKIKLQAEKVFRSLQDLVRPKDEKRDER